MQRLFVASLTFCRALKFGLCRCFMQKYCKMPDVKSAHYDDCQASACNEIIAQIRNENRQRFLSH